MENSIIQTAAAEYLRTRKPGPTVFINIFADGEPVQYPSIDDAAEMAIEPGYLYTVMIRDAVPIMLDLEWRGSDLEHDRRQAQSDQEQYERDCSSLELADRV
jgi:hypothetical protein